MCLERLVNILELELRFTFDLLWLWLWLWLLLLLLLFIIMFVFISAFTLRIHMRIHGDVALAAHTRRSRKHFIYTMHCNWWIDFKEIYLWNFDYYFDLLSIQIFHLLVFTARFFFLWLYVLLCFQFVFPRRFLFCFLLFFFSFSLSARKTINYISHSLFFVHSIFFSHFFLCFLFYSSVNLCRHDSQCR